MVVSFAQPNFYLDRIGSVIVTNYEAFTAKSDPDEFIHYENLTSSWLSILKNMPKAIFSGLFRPLPGDGHSWLSWLAKIEHILILLLAFAALWRLPGQLNYKKRLLLLAAITYCMVLAGFLALSAPNFGTLIRYKVGFLPIFIVLITFQNPLIKKIKSMVL